MDTTDVGREKVASRSAEVTKEVGWMSEDVVIPSSSGLGDDSSGKSSNSSPENFKPFSTAIFGLLVKPFCDCFSSKQIIESPQ